LKVDDGALLDDGDGIPELDDESKADALTDAVDIIELDGCKEGSDEESDESDRTVEVISKLDEDISVLEYTVVDESREFELLELISVEDDDTELRVAVALVIVLDKSEVLDHVDDSIADELSIVEDSIADDDTCVDVKIDELKSIPLDDESLVDDPRDVWRNGEDDTELECRLDEIPSEEDVDMSEELDCSADDDESIDISLEDDEIISVVEELNPAPLDESLLPEE
jgi:hypothetical protein